MGALIDLAFKFSTSGSLSDEHYRRMLVAAALGNPELNKFIDEHKEGWIGVPGEFARTLANVCATI